MFKKSKAHLLISFSLVAMMLAACGQDSNTPQVDGNSQTSDSSQASATEQKVIIYTNSDDEAQAAMSKALNEAGYDGKYMIQTFGTSELGGKLLAEGKNIEADVVTMSTYFLEGAQQKNHMFIPLTFERKTLETYPDFYAPITSQEGTIIVNTKELEASGLARPTSLKELSEPIYKDKLSIPDPNGSSTAWLLTQAVVSAYGDGDDGKAVINGLIENAGDHVTQSGSAPLKLVRAGEVIFGFGLRQQVVRDKLEGKPIDFIDPTEGNFALEEGIAVVDKGDKINPLSEKIAATVIQQGRKYLLKYYPNALYAGEVTEGPYKSTYPKVFSQPLTMDLLEQHKAFYHNKY